MRKLAVFTEGQTEQLFLKKFIEEVGGARNINFEIRTVPSKPVIARMVSLDGQGEEPAYSVLLYDCQNDERVKSEILEHLTSLTSAGYRLVLGLRDLYPTPLSDIARVKLQMRTRVPTGGIPVHILLAVAEVEAWFLQDESHFGRIDPELNVEDFKRKFGFDPRTDSAENVTMPAALLHQIYASVGKAYRKTKFQVQRTVDVLDYESLYCAKGNELPHLNELIGHLDAFFDDDRLQRTR